MKKSTEIICGCATICFLTAITVWLFCFSKLSNNCTDMQIHIWLITAAPVLAYLLLSFMTFKGVPVPLFIITTIAATGGGAYLFIRSVSLEPFSLRTLIVICVIYCLAFIAGAFMAFDPVKENGVITRFDISVFMMIILLVINNWLNFPAFRPAVIMCIIAIFASLIALISIRVGKYSEKGETVQGTRNAGKILMAAIAAVLAAFAAAVYFFTAHGLENASDIIVKIITWIINILKAVITFIWNCINAFFLWLASLFHPETMESADIASDNIQMNFSADETVQAQVPLWFYIVIGGIVLLALILLIIRFRKNRLKKAVLTRQNSNNTIIRSSHFRNALLSLIRKIRAKLIFRFNCIRYRNTLPGLIILCSKTAPKEISWSKNESAAAFIKKYADYLSDKYTDASASYDSLYTLARLSEQALYSGKEVTVPADLYAKVRAALKAAR